MFPEIDKQRDKLAEEFGKGFRYERFQFEVIQAFKRGFDAALKAIELDANPPDHDQT